MSPAKILVQWTEIHLKIQLYISTDFCLTCNKMLKKNENKQNKTNPNKWKIINNQSFHSRKNCPVWQKLLNSIYFLILAEDFTDLLLQNIIHIVLKTEVFRTTLLQNYLPHSHTDTVSYFDLETSQNCKWRRIFVYIENIIFQSLQPLNISYSIILKYRVSLLRIYGKISHRLQRKHDKMTEQ